MRTILIVDEQPICREPLAAVLGHEGYHTLTAGDGVAALELARGEHPDLILLDILIPEMDGMAVLRALRADPHLRHTPVMVLSAVRSKQQILDVARYGVRHYLLKSDFSLEELRLRLRYCLGEVPAQPAAAVTVVKAATGAPPARPAPAADAQAVTPPPATPTRLVTPKMLKMDATEALKQIRPLKSRSEIQELLEGFADLKAMSPSVAQLMQMTQHAECSIERVAQVIRQDQAIALRVLRLSNSSAYVRGEPVTSVDKAVVRVGLSAIRQMILNIAVLDRFSEQPDQGALNIPHFWEHAIACGLIASELAQAVGDPAFVSDDAFTMGLLHDVGKMVLLEVLGDEYRLVLETARALELPVEQVESRLLLINHADVMDRLLHAWGFSPHLINPITYHHLSAGNIRRTTPRDATPTAALAMANRLAHALVLGASGNDTLYAIDKFLDVLGLDPKVIADLEHRIPTQTEDLRFGLLAHLATHSGWTSKPDELRKLFHQPFAPLHVSGSPAVDTTRIFCDRLRDASAPAPNVAMIRINDAAERARLAEQLTHAEQEAQVRNLPAIVFSSTGKVNLEGQVMANRPAALLPLPVRMSRIIETVNQLLAAGAEVAESAAA